MTTDGSGRLSWELNNNNLIAMTKIENDADAAISFTVPASAAAGGADIMGALTWTLSSGATNPVAGCTFEVPRSGKVRVVFSGTLKDAGGATETWVGLHNTFANTDRPAHGWFQIAKDSEDGEHDLEDIEWYIDYTSELAGTTVSVYLLAITSAAAGTEFLVGRQCPNAWSAIDLPKATTIKVFDVNGIDIQENPVIKAEDEKDEGK